MIDITSINNQQVKEWKKLHTKKERKKTQSYILEGYHLVEEALRFAKEDIKHIIVREDILTNSEYLSLVIDSELITTVSIQVANEISETESNQGIFAVISIPSAKKFDFIKKPFLLLDAVQDPGNVGTMIRTADAAGFQGVILGKGSVDLYNSKTLRSAQGSHFHLDVFEGDLNNYISEVKGQGLTVYGTALNEKAISYKEINVVNPFALIVGNEGSGISEEIMALIDQNIYIPMKGHTESLNVAIAASIIMFQLN